MFDERPGDIPNADSAQNEYQKSGQGKIVLGACELLTHILLLFAIGNGGDRRALEGVAELADQFAWIFGGAKQDAAADAARVAGDAGRVKRLFFDKDAAAQPETIGPAGLFVKSRANGEFAFADLQLVADLDLKVLKKDLGDHGTVVAEQCKIERLAA